jgi:predicted nuclease of predicted toxin-antitoxin system
MKLLLDQGTPRSAAALLRQAGLDVAHTAEIGLAAASDAEILVHAVQAGAVVVTLDADFHTLLALSSAAQPSVIRIRVEGLRAGEFSELLQRVIASCEADIIAGAVISVREHEVRVRRLPIR